MGWSSAWQILGKRRTAALERDMIVLVTWVDHGGTGYWAPCRNRILGGVPVRVLSIDQYTSDARQLRYEIQAEQAGGSRLLVNDIAPHAVWLMAMEPNLTLGEFAQEVGLTPAAVILDSRGLITPDWQAGDVLDGLVVLAIREQRRQLKLKARRARR